MNLLEAKLHRFLGELLANDPALATEVDALQQDESFNRQVRVLAAQLADLGDDPEDLARQALTLLATRPNPNPVVRVIGGEPRLEFPDLPSAIWKARLEAAVPYLLPAIRAVGRIEVVGLRGSDWVGTGVMLCDGVVVTNQHVAGRFAERFDGKLQFRLNGALQAMEPSIDFLEEAGNPDSLVFEIVEPLHLQENERPDVALLRVKAGGDHPLPSPLTLAVSNPQPGDFIAAIGYPRQDSSAKHQDLIDRVFGKVFDKKRVAPGQVRQPENRFVRHDCSTLAGNSGSPLVHLGTGEVVGLHFEGEFAEENFAVSAPDLRVLLQAAGCEMDTGRLLPAGDSGDGASNHERRPVITVTIPIHVNVTVQTPVVTSGLHDAEPN